MSDLPQQDALVAALSRLIHTGAPHNAIEFYLFIVAVTLILGVSSIIFDRTRDGGRIDSTNLIRLMFAGSNLAVAIVLLCLPFDVDLAVILAHEPIILALVAIQLVSFTVSEIKSVFVSKRQPSSEQEPPR